MSTLFSSPVFKSFSLISLVPNTKYKYWGGGKGVCKNCERTTPNKFLTTEWGKWHFQLKIPVFDRPSQNNKVILSLYLAKRFQKFEVLCL